MITTFLFFATNILMSLSDIGFPFTTCVNNLALRKLFFKSDIVYYENARFLGEL